MNIDFEQVIFELLRLSLSGGVSDANQGAYLDLFKNLCIQSINIYLVLIMYELCEALGYTRQHGRHDSYPHRIYSIREIVVH